MNIGPIWRALMRSKSSYILIALQIAVTMAIIVNAIAIIQERSRLMSRPSGVDEDNIFYISSDAFGKDVNYRSLIENDLRDLRALPGVVNAISTNSVPLRGGGWSMALSREPGLSSDGSSVALYFTDQNGIETLGVNLVEGRNFREDEIVWSDPQSNQLPAQGIITRAMADTLFPDETGSVVGKTVYINENDPVQIIGIVERLQAPWNGWDGVERSILMPMIRQDPYVRYVIRVEPGLLDSMMPKVEEMLATSNRSRIVERMRTMNETRRRSYLGDSALVTLLSFTALLLTGITGLGIVGLASFNVSRRTRQIGTRRALGATRGSILAYFMLENFLVSSVGIAAGAVLSVALNVWMVQAFELTRISWYLIPAAMLMLWLVGQIAAAGPARRASLVPPAVATRAV